MNDSPRAFRKLFPNSVSCLVLLSLIIAVSSCSVNLHPAYSHSSSSTDVYKTVVNDSAGVSFKGPADIDYITDVSLARKFLKKTWELNTPENILFVGASNIEPFYSFIVVMDSEEEFDHPNYSGIRIHSFQRKIDGHRVDLIAHGKEANLRPDDFLFILDNMSIAD